MSQSSRRVELRAVGQDLLEPDLLAGLQGVGSAQDPPGNLANGGRRGPWRRRGPSVAQPVRVAAHGLLAAPVAQRRDHLGESGGIGRTFGPALCR
jgi:hypothetical protein